MWKTTFAEALSQCGTLLYNSLRVMAQQASPYVAKHVVVEVYADNLSPCIQQRNRQGDFLCFNYILILLDWQSTSTVLSRSVAFRVSESIAMCGLCVYGLIGVSANLGNGTERVQKGTQFSYVLHKKFLVYLWTESNWWVKKRLSKFVEKVC